ncbi:PAS domain-containing protein [Flavobacterium gelidilacus]|uniref:PAS domain-containing protein n=1 Tax=Flavobacterium gelidilacus TaxID=206041 RepID=UPI00041FEA68|nr:PAS domain-containing protein [Flavobacterium gelidilacus]
MPLKDIKHKSSVFHKIIFTISLFVILFIGAITFKHINNISDSSKLLMHTYEVNLELEHLFSYIKDSENSMRGYLISKDTLYLEPYRTATKNVNNTFLQLKKLTYDNPQQQQNLQDLFKIVNKRYEYMKTYSEQNRRVDISRNINFKKNFRESSKLLVDIRDKLNEMVDLEETYLKKRNSEYNDQIYLTPILTLGILFMTLMLLIFAYNQTTKDVDKLQAANTKLNKSQFLSYQAEILSHFGTWEWNLNNDKLIYSDNLYRILGAEPQSFEANNDNFLKYVHPDYIESVNVIMQKILDNEELPYSYFKIQRADGQTRLLRATGKLFVDKLGNKTVLGVTEDITEEHLKGELLKSSNEDLIKVNNELKIFDESSRQAEILGQYGSWVLNYDTLEFKYSDNKFRLLGCEPQSFNPSIDKLLEFVHPDDRQIVIDANESAMKTKQIPTMDYRIIRSDGEIRHFKTIAKSFKDLSGVASMIGTTQDVTEDYIKSEQLKIRNKELEQNIKELSEFNHVASHDLQEPLRKIQTFISRINDKEKENLSDFGKEYLTRIEKASNRMRVLINDLLQYSRTNRTEKIFEKTDLNEQFNNSLLELSQNIEDKRAIINHNKLPEITGISFQMQQLFTNLLSNSLKYAKENVAPIINVELSETVAKNESRLKDSTTKKYYKIEFSDNGIGFDQENAEKIFLLFNRLHGKTEYQGTGVGLAICKKIVETHDGQIFASSQLGQGATFTIYFPV